MPLRTGPGSPTGDASVVPDIPSGNVNAPAVTVSKQGTDLIPAHVLRGETIVE